MCTRFANPVQVELILDDVQHDHLLHLLLRRRRLALTHADVVVLLQRIPLLVDELEGDGGDLLRGEVGEIDALWPYCLFYVKHTGSRPIAEVGV